MTTKTTKGIITILVMYMDNKTDKECEDVCDAKRAPTHLRIKNSEWNLRDACVCFFSDRIETVMLGG